MTLRDWQDKSPNDIPHGNLRSVSKPRMASAATLDSPAKAEPVPENSCSSEAVTNWRE